MNFDDLKIDERCSFDEFVLMPTNAEAHAAARNVAEERNGASPLHICGRNGCGKTHLLNAIGKRYAETHPGKRVILTTGARMMANSILARRNSELESFREWYGCANLLLIDEIAYAEKTLQDFLIDMFDEMIMENRMIVFASLVPCARSWINSWLLSRSFSKHIFEIRRMSEGECFEFLQCQLKKRGVSISENNVSLLLRAVTGDASSLVRIAEDVRVAAEAYSGEATGACVRDVLTALEK